MRVKKKLLVIGISGLTGYKIANLASRDSEVVGTFNTRPVKLDNVRVEKFDINSIEKTQNLLKEIKPDIVINTSALHNVDYCETNPDQARLVNRDFIDALNKNSKKLDFKIIHISTDYVFDGVKNSAYEETDNPYPLSVYGKTKLEGEKILENSEHIVIRPSVVYGWTPLELSNIPSSSGKPMNFAMWVLTKLNKGESLKIVTDQFASATLADSLAESIFQISKKIKPGTFHVSGLSCESRYDFTVKLALKFGYEPSMISPTTSTSFVQKAKRPKYSCLDCQKAIKEFGLQLLTTDESLEMMRNQVSKEAPYLLNKKN